MSREEEEDKIRIQAGIQLLGHKKTKVARAKIWQRSFVTFKTFEWNWKISDFSV